MLTAIGTTRSQNYAMRCKNTRTTVGASFPQKSVADFLLPHAEKRRRRWMWSRAPKTMINHNTKAATHHHNWAPAPAIPAEATNDWPITSVKASLAISRAFALGENEHYTTLWAVYKMDTRLCWLTTRRSWSFNMRAHLFEDMHLITYVFLFLHLLFNFTKYRRMLMVYPSWFDKHSLRKNNNFKLLHMEHIHFYLSNVSQLSEVVQTKLVTAERAWHSIADGVGT
jgi:hypothetical protein